ncbi:O-antigen translocase [Sabulilitoribacter arenilitoris]|uniref:O-antigen translocase n=1 Tax=Wocania arenilitoris TaxID=2044858 RepID=A0AAE3ESF4_9FLAO|nr:O-antigen translocase [Wocania arenilitoris]MCF7569494.1 O-antigen translocase [Wocania arenilitoris]
MNIPNYIKNNLLLKVTSANTIVVFIRMIFSVITQKVLAILIGAEGIALVGNLKNVTSFFDQFSILGISNGLVKYISEFRGNKKKINELFSTAIVFEATASVVSFVILFFWSNSLNNIIFGENSNYVYIFKVLAFVIPFMGMNRFLFSVLNGISAYKLYSKIAFGAIILSTLLIVILTLNDGLNGSLLAICLIPLVQFFSYLVFISKKIRAYFNFKNISFKLSFKNELLSYSFMTVIVVISINVADVLIRNLIIENVSVNEAGYWTALGSISKNYMQFLVAIFSLYILPQYAKINNSFDFRKEVIKIYKLLLPIFAIGLLLVYFFRDILIEILFTEDFLSMSVLFKWQLLGDFVKLTALVLSYQFIAKRQISNFVFTELLSVIMFYVFSNCFIHSYNTEGIVLAHFVRYVIYLVVVLFILRHNFIGKNRVL